MVKSINGVLWYCCPVCGQKLFKVGKNAQCSGIYLLCKKCKWNGEIIIKGDGEEWQVSEKLTEKTGLVLKSP